MFAFLVSSFFAQMIYQIFSILSSYTSNPEDLKKNYVLYMVQDVTPIIFDATSTLVILILHYKSFLQPKHLLKPLRNLDTSNQDDSQLIKNSYVSSFAKSSLNDSQDSGASSKSPNYKRNNSDDVLKAHITEIKIDQSAQ